jgi:hypothetical protein
MRLLQELVDTGKVRSKDELRTVYKSFVKKYHPDSRPETDKAIDFDELKRDYRAAALKLEELWTGRPGSARDPAAFRYEAASFVGEFRDLVARGLPVNAKALRKNKAYAASMAYVSKGIAQLYGEAYSFPELDAQLKFLYRRLGRVYYYVLQALWSAFDCANGYLYAQAIALRHLDCVSSVLVEMGYASLDRFLRDFIELSARVGALVDPRA